MRRCYYWQVKQVMGVNTNPTCLEVVYVYLIHDRLAYIAGGLNSWATFGPLQLF